MKNIELYGYVLRFCVVIGVLCVNYVYYWDFSYDVFNRDFIF